ncbi:MAG: type II toxin-antitoxin system HicB family antitoxin [Candidatus Brockarchaeota archaeon]|nr:type II toxin-antitoxin system HicB family antitoxin [Candidatus Brockarchaeota archaeon]
MKLVQVKIYRGERYYIAECVDIPLFTYGRTLDEVVEKMREAVAPCLKNDGLKEWETPPDFSILLNLELSSPAEKQGVEQTRFS